MNTVRVAIYASPVVTLRGSSSLPPPVSQSTQVYGPQSHASLSQARVAPSTLR